MARIARAVSKGSIEVYFFPRHLLPITGALLFCCLLLVSCHDSTSGRSYTRIFRYNQPNAVTSLDPAFARSQSNIWAVSHMYNGLVQLSEQLEIVPSIAENWEISDSGRTYTFHLRRDVRFHDDDAFPNGQGRVVTARDVVFSFSRILDESVNSPGSWIFSDKVAVSDPFSAPDDTTFVLRLRRPFLPMLGILTMPYCYIVPREAVETYGFDFRTHPVGTGPFQYRNWLEGEALALVRNDNYFESADADTVPWLDGILVSFISDRKTAYLELLQGELDFISGLESAFVDDVLTSQGELQPRHAGKIKFVKAPFLNSEYLGIALQAAPEDSPLHDRRVRQALNWGFDRDLMLRSLRNMVGRPAHSGFVPRGLPSHDPQKVKGYSYRPDLARQLLAEAGYPGGTGMPSITLHTTKDYLDLCTFITRQWEDLGIMVKIEMMESATLRQMMSNGQVAFFRASWIADYPDAESFLTVFYGGNPAPPNYTGFKHPEFDSLYEQALLEVDDTLRYGLYQRMDSILVQEAPVVFLFYDETAKFTAEKVNGVSRNALNMPDVRTIRYDP